MSTLEEGYVTSINCICYKELSQSLEVNYIMTVEQNVARSFELFPFLSRCFSRSVTVPPQL